MGNTDRQKMLRPEVDGSSGGMGSYRSGSIEEKGSSSPRRFDQMPIAPIGRR
jgi:hypothetical protein